MPKRLTNGIVSEAGERLDIPYVIKRDGTLETGRELEVGIAKATIITVSVFVSLAVLTTMVNLIQTLLINNGVLGSTRMGTKSYPDAEIVGHNEFSSKAAQLLM